MNGKQAKFLRSIKASKQFKKKYKACPHYVRGIYRGMMSISPADVPFTRLADEKSCAGSL